MFALPRRATALWLATAVAAAVSLIVALPFAVADLRWAPIAILFAIACAISETFRVNLPTSRPGNHMYFSLAGTIMVAALLVLPTPWAILALGAGRAAGNRAVWFKRVFNAGATVLSAAAGGLAWQNAPAPAHPSDAANIPWAIMAVLLVFVGTSWVSGAMVALVTVMPVRVTLWRTNRNTWPASLG